MATTVEMVPLVSKFYCSSSEVVLVVRTRPHVVNGGGFVVTDCDQKVVFSVDGCGILGKEGELILRDEKRDALLLLRGKVYLLIIHYSTNRSFVFFMHINECFCDYQNSDSDEHVLEISILFCFREGFLKL